MKANWSIGFFRSTFIFMVFFADNVVAQGQYPDKPITLIVPYAAGGSNDLNARVFTSFLDDYLGQPVLIKLVPGQAGQ